MGNSRVHTPRHLLNSLKMLILIVLAFQGRFVPPSVASPLSVPVGSLSPTMSLSPGLSLNVEESAWLAAHPEIKMGINRAWPPMDYVDGEGIPQGIGVGFIKALNTRLGGRLKIVPLSWTDMYEGVQEKRIDAIMDITPRPDREAFFNFTTPYLTVPHSIIAPKDTVYYENLNSLKGKTVALESRFFMEGLLHEKYPDINVKPFNTTSDALDAVSKGEADAYVGNRAVATYIIERELIANLEVHGKIAETASVNAIGVRKDQPILRDILQKGLDDLGKEEVSEILEDWKNPHKEEKTIQLSDRERTWLKDHPRITIAFDGDYAPYSFRNEKGEFKGIAVDFARELASSMGIGLHVYPEGTWKRLYQAALKGEVDVIATLVLRPERQPFFEFTKPYISIAQYVIARKEDDTIHSREDVVGKTIAVVKGYATTDQILDEFPSVKPYPVDNLTSALEAVSTGKAEIAVA
ncbi:MAG TPA: transporter substrate-binding domain-containing protein, partial [Desulfobacteria bacterium]|nr:transporter substrate-binding domain-containing protein [Desulfobacteria bacterium]